MKYACMLAVVLGALSVEAQVPPSAGGTPSAYPIYWPRNPDTLRTRPQREVGLLYTPELLAALAQRAPDSVTPRIATAIRDQTPIVVMWTFPPGLVLEGLTRPFSVVITEQGSSWGWPRTEPLWVRQDANDLRMLDPRMPDGEVGVMAAFPRSAFVPGYIVSLYADLPAYRAGQHRGVQVFGRIEWNGGPSTPNVGRR